MFWYLLPVIKVSIKVRVDIRCIGYRCRSHCTIKPIVRFVNEALCFHSKHSCQIQIEILGNCRDVSESFGKMDAVFSARFQGLWLLLWGLRSHPKFKVILIHFHFLDKL
ncbi:unnamed protein product [Ilex paraguariensis]|uniref:Uncharacterized protein n=1 Tax=Ilex paraguariensis TaxID=185542 RepID=A0ABC8UX76_9AQUA